MDWRQMLRMASIFGPQQTESTFPGIGGPMIGPSGTPPINPENDYDVSARMGQLYQPETQSIDRFNTMIGQYPGEANPGKLRRIGAAAAGFAQDAFGRGGGMNTFNEIMYGEHNRKVQNWKNQIEPTERAANIERQSNVNSRTNAYQTVAAELRDRAATAKEANDSRRAQIAEQRAAVYEFKARNPNLRIVITKGGNVMAINPLTGEPMDTGIPSGSLSDADRISLTQENRIKTIEAQGSQQRKTQEEGHEDDLAEIEARAEEARRTKATPSASATTPKPPSEASIRTGRVNKATQLMNQRPDLAKWIKVNGTDVRIDPINPGGMFGRGPTPEEFKEINDFIYGPSAVTPGPTTNVPPPTSGGNRGNPTPNTSTPMSKQVKNKTTGEIITVYSRDGGKTWTRQ